VIADKITRVIPLVPTTTAPRPGLLAIPVRAYRLARIPLIYLRMGRSVADAWRAVKLRLSSTGVGARFRRQGLQTLHLRALGEPIAVRPATSDFSVVRQIYELGEYEPARAWTLPPGSTYWDLGGNIGLATLYFDSVFPGLRILAVEPDHENRQVLEQNCRHLIESGRMTVREAFVAAADGAAGIDRGDEAWGFKKIDAAPGAAAIPCLSVRTLLSQTGHEQIDLLKCDIEGSEIELFKNCAPWIGRVRHLIVETHDPYSVHALYDDLRRAGWDFDITYDSQGNGFGLCFLRRK
jgi:FkbM family methyltransferase